MLPQDIIDQLTQIDPLFLGIETLPGRFIHSELELDGLHGVSYIKGSTQSPQ